MPSSNLIPDISLPAGSQATTTTTTTSDPKQQDDQPGPSKPPLPNEGDGKPDSSSSSSSASSSNRKTTLSYLLHAASLHDSGRVAFLGSSSNMSLLLEPQGYDTYHFPLPEEISGTSSRLNEMDNEEIEILKFRGAFLLPPRDLCDDIVEAYFERIHPTIPLVNRTQFMRRYNDPSNPPSLLLLQAILLAGSRVCRNGALLDSTGSSELASLTFYKRVKALYDANYETDRIAIVQSLVLMGWWWEGPEDVTRNSFYWTRVALSVAQGFGLHRSVEKTSMTLVDKRLWKRIWWSLFLRDRWAAVALGRPVLINLEDSDVPMISEDDFNEDEPGVASPYPANRIHSLYFIHAVKLSEIMGFVLRQHFSIDAENLRRRNKVPSVSHCDMAMVSWMQNLPEELKYKVRDNANHNFFKALLHAQYYTILCLVHRSNILHETRTSSLYPSWGIAFQAAHMIAKIMENMLDYDEPRDCPAFFVYTLFSAMIMLIYQTESPIPTVVESARKALAICFKALKEMGRTWLVGRMVLKLFHQLNENKSLRDHFVRSARGASGFAPRVPRKRQHAGGANVAAAGSSGSGMGPARSKRRVESQTFDPNASRKKNTETGGSSAGEMSESSSTTLRDTPKTNVKRGKADDKSNGESTGKAPSSKLPTSPDWTFTNTHVTSPSTSGPTSIPSSTGSSAKAAKAVDPFTGPASASSILSPDFAFVTNTPPQGGSTFYENFQPSQLFPEPQESSVSPGGSSNANTATGGLGSSVPGSNPGDDLFLGNNGSLPGFGYGNSGVAPVVGTSVSPSDYASSDYNKSSPGDDLGLAGGSSGLSGITPSSATASAAASARGNGVPPGSRQGSMSWASGIADFQNTAMGMGMGLGMSMSGGGFGGGTGAPSSLNLGDWYTYLVSTFPGVEDIPSTGDTAPAASE